MSNEVTLAAEAGRPLGSRHSRRLRRDGRIPGVLYGHGIEPVPVSINGRDLRAALSTDAGLNALITLQVGGDSHLAVAKQLQRSKVRGTVEHIDFQIVRRDEIITAEVPVHLVGSADAVLKADGVVTQELNSLTVHTTPANVPSAIEVDVTDLEPGGTIRVSDLPLPSGVETDVDPESPVVSATVSTLEIPEPVEAEAGAEGEGAEAGEAASEARDEAIAEAEAAGDVDAGGDAAE